MHIDKVTMHAKESNLSTEIVEENQLSATQVIKEVYAK